MEFNHQHGREIGASEGEWFSIPLKGGASAAVLLARVDRSGDVGLGFFFAVDRSGDMAKYRPENAMFVARFDLGYIQARRWRRIGRDKVWNRSEWSVPPFRRTDLLGQETFRVEYSDDDILAPCREVRCNDDSVQQFPDDALLGAGAVEIRLARLLLGPVR